MTFFRALNAAARRRSAYLRTRHALRTLPLDTALDLGIYPGDADQIARRSVYGE